MMNEYQKKAQTHQQLESIADMKRFVEQYPQFRKISGINFACFRLIVLLRNNYQACANCWRAESFGCGRESLGNFRIGAEHCFKRRPFSMFGWIEEATLASQNFRFGKIYTVKIKTLLSRMHCVLSCFMRCASNPQQMHWISCWTN
jgi:hypothetical protein